MNWSRADLSIAVLPFETLSEDKANAYFADGIQEEISIAWCWQEFRTADVTLPAWRLT